MHDKSLPLQNGSSPDKLQLPSDLPLSSQVMISEPLRGRFAVHDRLHDVP